ncbi:MAG: carbohydrate kinase, partial [Rhizobiaceae bacterium]
MASTLRVPHIFAVGGAHIDRRGRMTAEFVAGASIPGTMREDVGGGTFNALRTAVRRGARGTLMSVRGGDGAGMRVAETMAAEGIADASAIFLDRA